MGKSFGIARLITVFGLAAVILIYNVCGAGTEGITSDGSAFSLFEDNGGVFGTDALENENQEQSVKTESTAEETKENSSVPAASKGEAKGKIISKYISPYNAALSYNGTYMKNSAGVDISLKALLESDINIKVAKNSEPQVLIMHTHTTETFMTEDTDYYTSAFSSRTRNADKNMVSVGKIVAEKLNSAGIKTLHDATEHDYPQYTGSYTRSAATVKSYLKKYPSIKIVLDLHRDAVSSGESDKVKLVTEIGGKKAAQIMLVMGAQSGSVTGFPNWKENLKLAVKLQQMIEIKYPTLARPLSLVAKNYNQSLTTGSMLIEFGTDANTLSEVHYSAELVADSMVSLFNTLT